MINDKWIKKNYILENITKGGEGIAYMQVMFQNM